MRIRRARQITTPETRAKLKSALEKRIKENGHPVLGYKHTPEARAKISAASRAHAAVRAERASDAQNAFQF